MSVADHSRHVVRRLQNCVIHTLSFSFWEPSDLHVLLNEDNDGQCWQQPKRTFLSDEVLQQLILKVVTIKADLTRRKRSKST